MLQTEIGWVRFCGRFCCLFDFTPNIVFNASGIFPATWKSLLALNLPSIDSNTCWRGFRPWGIGPFSRRFSSRVLCGRSAFFATPCMIPQNLRNHVQNVKFEGKNGHLRTGSCYNEKFWRTSVLFWKRAVNRLKPCFGHAKTRLHERNASNRRHGTLFERIVWFSSKNMLLSFMKGKQSQSFANLSSARIDASAQGFHDKNYDFCSLASLAVRVISEFISAAKLDGTNTPHSN